MKFLLVWFLTGILEVQFGKGDEPRWRVGHSYPQPLPQEIMVDAVNYIGLVLLHAHNSNNENNIALSPYGATSVLVALGEGVQGSALDEILRATLLPLDVSVTRVGLRDIHRHLKSYFIPQEGFLAGLTFSHENVTLKTSYEDILRFYGYDVDSFNNPLYPDPSTSTTTEYPSSESSESDSSSSSSSSSSTETTTPTAIITPTTIENRDQFTDVDSFNNPLYTNPSTSTTTEYPSSASSESNSSSSSSSSSSTETTTPTTIVTPTTIENRDQFTDAESTIPPNPSQLPTTIPPTTTNVLTANTRSSTVDQTTPSTLLSPSTIPLITTVATTVNTQPVTSLNTEPQTSTLPSTIPPTTTRAPTIQPPTTTIQSPTTIQPPTTTIQLSTSTIPPTVPPPSTTSAVTTTQPPTTTNPTTSPVPATTIPPSPSTTQSSTPPVTTIQTTTALPTTVAQPDTTVSLSNTVTTTNSGNSVTTTQGITAPRPTSITLNIDPTTIGSGGAIPLSTTEAALVTTPTIGADGSISINFQPTTVASTAGTTNGPTTVTSETTTEPTSATTNLSTNDQDSSITISVVPSTVGTGSTEATTAGTTENPVTINVPPGGDLPTGFEIGVTPTTVDPRILEARDIRSVATSTGTLTRFKDDRELVKLKRTESNSAPIKMVRKRSLVSHQIDSTNYFGNGPGTNKNSETTVFTNEDFIDIGEETSTEELRYSTRKLSGEPSPISLFTTITTHENSISSSESSSSTIRNSTFIETNSTTVSETEDSSSASEGTSTEVEWNFSEGISTDDFENNMKGKTRATRSVIDYLIARYHDNNAQAQSQITSGYQPMKPTTFAVNGKIREPNISFMTYDTVLPFRYISYLNALALTFPLDSTKYYLLLVLPVDEMGIDNLVNNMLSTTLKQIIYNLQPTRVKATIPSFMLKGYVVLTPTLQKLGIRQIFEPRHADFSRMTDDKDIYVTNIEQAVTVTIRNYVDPATLQNNQHFRRRGPVHFLADHPFLYFVMDSQIHVALMAGKIVNPLNSRIR